MSIHRAIVFAQSWGKQRAWHRMDFRKSPKMVFRGHAGNPQAHGAVNLSRSCSQKMSEVHRTEHQVRWNESFKQQQHYVEGQRRYTYSKTNLSLRITCLLRILLQSTRQVQSGFVQYIGHDQSIQPPAPGNETNLPKIFGKNSRLWDITHLDLSTEVPHGLLSNEQPRLLARAHLVFFSSSLNRWETFDENGFRSFPFWRRGKKENSKKISIGDLRSSEFFGTKAATSADPLAIVPFDQHRSWMPVFLLFEARCCCLGSILVRLMQTSNWKPKIYIVYITQLDMLTSKQKSYEARAWSCCRKVTEKLWTDTTTSLTHSSCHGWTAIFSHHPTRLSAGRDTHWQVICTATLHFLHTACMCEANKTNTGLQIDSSMPGMSGNQIQAYQKSVSVEVHLFDYAVVSLVVRPGLDEAENLLQGNYTSIDSK